MNNNCERTQKFEIHTHSLIFGLITAMCYYSSVSIVSCQASIDGRAALLCSDNNEVPFNHVLTHWAYTITVI